MTRSRINRLSALLLATASQLCTSSAAGADSAERFRWVDIDPAENPKISQTIDGQCLPDARHFAFRIPVEAHVLFVFWDKDRTYCEANDPISNDKPDTVIFLSRQTPS